MKGSGIAKYALALLFACLLPVCVSAQIKSATIGVNGLTCSQCSRSVEMALQKLPFVAKVEMDLTHTTGTVYFKNNSKIDLTQLAQAPRNAGFSTAFVRLAFDFSKINPGKYCFVYKGKVFYFLQPLANNHPSLMDFQVIGSGFLPKKELKTYSLKPNGSCVSSEKFFLKPVNG